jgi:hypothetical protein
MNVPRQHLNFVVSPDLDGKLPISPSSWIGWKVFGGAVVGIATIVGVVYELGFPPF